ncbi:MAG TPA: 2-oxoglutarate dehydrogenase E1 component [Chloroflexota bacterium]|nr:2-oxoglutarate dehydrogenase E1 component [Chloroflexota bacterium]
MNGRDDAGAPAWSEFAGPNAAYLLDLYERYAADPTAVDAATRALFERRGPPPLGAPGAPGATAPAAPAAPALSGQLVAGGDNARRAAAAVSLAQAIAAFGYRAAQLDPLGSPPPGDPELLPETHGLSEADLAALPAAIIGGPAAEGAATALDAIRRLRAIYAGTTGYEFEHVSDAEERVWLRNAVESGRFAPPHDPIDERRLLERLTEVGALERFLQRALPGQTRFSLEGLGMLVPMLDEIVGAAAEAGTRAVLLGMAHRGRLNVLAHVLGKPYDQMLAEFMGQLHRANVAPSDQGGESWTGDVQYHLGARRAYPGGAAVELTVCLAPNPSHLEFVDPVVEGMTRASDERRDAPGPARQDELASLAVLIHGDASFPGQGVVAETLNLSRLPGYRTGGTLHIIANNQLGFTTPPAEGRSTAYASDLAKGFEVPVIHVNADDPVACVAATRLAHAYRERFRKDVLIDLIGYRRWGHNEGDEPAFTQPRLYARIAQHPTVRERWAAELVRRGLVTAAEVDAMLQAQIERLHAIRRALPAAPPDALAAASTGREGGGASGGLGHQGAAVGVETAVPAAELVALNEQLLAWPPGFHLHPKLERPFSRRRAALASLDGHDEPRVDWAHAEALAFASILADGTPIRLTGQDVARGTFSQRHLVLHDVETGAPFIPLQALPAARASFEVWNSPLSEQAALGFEFGYSVQAPEALVLWEAQYGDFVNGAQVIVDQFIVSAQSKWGQRPSLVLLLPHGYEGQGPEHSSARPERFLQLAAEDNLRIANCTTAAQYFHLLRRQARLLAADPRPLVVFTPKSLLRHPLAAAPLVALATGRFQPVLDDPLARQGPAAVRRLVLCSGKVYVDLVASGQQAGPAGAAPAVAVARVEELYPFPQQELADLVAAYPRLEEVVWLQEEPRNMGAWLYMAPRLRDLLGGRLPLVYVGRARRASPAEGIREWHVQAQARLVEAAFRFEPVAAAPAAAREV